MAWQVREEYEALRKARLDGFMAGFNAISMKLKEMYQMITLGGDAELELVDSLDPFSEVRFSILVPSSASRAPPVIGLWQSQPAMTWQQEHCLDWSLDECKDVSFAVS